MSQLEEELLQLRIPRPNIEGQHVRSRVLQMGQENIVACRMTRHQQSRMEYPLVGKAIFSNALAVDRLMVVGDAMAAQQQQAAIFLDVCFVRPFDMERVVLRECRDNDLSILGSSLLVTQPALMWAVSSSKGGQQQMKYRPAGIASELYCRFRLELPAEFTVSSVPR